MCGFCGFVQPGSYSAKSHSILKKMRSRIEHRGPDASGDWSDQSNGVFLTHARLAIQDLTLSGSQPMKSRSNRFVVVFNGEIYNHLDLRSELEQSGLVSSWKGTSDTETLLEAIDIWGLEATLPRISGMFAFSVWDSKEKLLHLVRDRFGEKPLYYGFQSDVFLFGSELSAFEEHPEFTSAIDRKSLNLYLQYNYVPAPYSIYEGIFKLPPASFVTLDSLNFEKSLLPEPRKYWEIEESIQKSRSIGLSRFEGYEPIRLLDDFLGSAVSSQLISDVPVGAFLSGGYDSTAIVAQMVKHARGDVKTFTIGSSIEDQDESKVAKEISRILGTNHTEYVITPEDAIEVIKSLPSIYSEPFADSSQIPTYLVSKIASQEVKVALSGDAGDEIFGGYNRYSTAAQVWENVQKLPKTYQIVITKMLKSLSPASWNILFSRLNTLLPESKKIKGGGDKIQKLIQVLNVDSAQEYFEILTSQLRETENYIIDSNPKHAFSGSNRIPLGMDFREWMMSMDTQHYLPDDILVKVDRAAMANGLETRVPFLDLNLFEFAWGLPLSSKIERGQGKKILRELVHEYVPRDLLNRPKSGFGIPIDQWLRGPLRAWAEELIDPVMLNNQGYFNSESVRKLWTEHLLEVRNNQHQLWTILMFQAWLLSTNRSS